MKQVTEKIVFFLTILFLPSLIHSQDIQSLCNDNEVVNKVSNLSKRNFYSSKWYNSSHSRAGEFLLDTNVTYVLTPFDQRYPSVAFDGTNYFVVWGGDSRSRFGGIFGARIDTLGNVLDPAGIQITPNYCWYYNGSDPAVYFNGTNFLVVWVDLRNNKYDIYGSRVDQAGNILDTNGIEISSDVFRHQYPSVASDGTNYLVVWEQKQSGNFFDIRGCRVSASGSILDTNGIVISTDKGRLPSVVFDGTNYFVVWKGDGSSKTIYGARINQAGTVLDPTGIEINYYATTDYAFPSVAFDGINYLVIWENDSNLVYGARVTTNGTVLDPSGFQISDSPTSSYQSVAFDGINYFVVWPGKGARVSQAGILIDTTSIIIPSGGAMSELSFGGSRYLVVGQWLLSGYGYYIIGTQIDTSGTVLDTIGINISTSAYSQTEPSIAFDGQNYLAIYADCRNEPHFDIYGTRINQSGTIIDQQGFVISSLPCRQYSPVITFGGDNYFAAWRDYRNESYSDIYGSRISPSGTILDSSGIAISCTTGHQRSPAVSFDGTNFLVVWVDERHGGGDIYGARVDSLGNVIDFTGLPINTLLDGGDPSVAFDGTNYLIVWQSSQDIYGARVTPTGGILDPSGFLISYTTNTVYQPSVTYGGNNYFVVYYEYYGAFDSYIYGARVSPSGTPIDSFGIQISANSNYKYNPVVSYDGEDYFVVWEEWVEGPNSLYGALIDTSGNVNSPFLIHTQNGDVANPVLTKGINNQLLLTWSGWTPEINGQPTNTMRIWGKFNSSIAIEEKPHQSTSKRIKITAYPNPFSGNLLIKCQYSKRFERILLKVYDISGRLIQEFPLQREVTWNGKDSHGHSVPPGIYFIKVDGKPVGKVVKVR